MGFTYNIGFPPLSFGPTFGTFDEALAFLRWFCVDDELAVGPVEKNEKCKYELHNIHNTTKTTEMKLRHHENGYDNDEFKTCMMTLVLERHSPMHIFQREDEPEVEPCSGKTLFLVKNEGLFLCPEVAIGDGQSQPAPINKWSTPTSKWCTWSSEHGLRVCLDQKNPDARNVGEFPYQLIPDPNGYRFRRT